MLKPDPSARDGYRAPRSGEIFRNPLLGRTFQLLAEHGRKGFYEGPVAKAIVDITRSLRGHLTLEDLKIYGQRGSELTEAVSITLDKGILSDSPATASGSKIRLWEHPPNGQGIVAQMALGILQELDKQGKMEKLQPMDHNSPRFVPFDYFYQFFTSF